MNFFFKKTKFIKKKILKTFRNKIKKTLVFYCSLPQLKWQNLLIYINEWINGYAVIELNCFLRDGETKYDINSSHNHKTTIYYQIKK